MGPCRAPSSSPSPNREVLPLVFSLLRAPEPRCARKIPACASTPVKGRQPLLGAEATRIVGQAALPAWRRPHVAADHAARHAAGPAVADRLVVAYYAPFDDVVCSTA